MSELQAQIEHSPSPWIKVIGGSTLVIAAIMGFNAYSASKEQDCSDFALHSGESLLVTITDTRWKMNGCEYLVRWNGTGTINWESELMVRQLHEGARKQR